VVEWTPERDAVNSRSGDQRDYFGSHTYERVDKPGVAVHSDWAALAGRR
jgi:6-phosphogluconate dehydrogenase